jgi:hypothetical protein
MRARRASHGKTLMWRRWIAGVLWFCACAPTGAVYLGSDVSPDAGHRRDASAEHEPATPEPRQDATTPQVVEDAGRPAQVEPQPMLPMTPPPASAEPVRCSTGTADCDEDAGNGCEIDLMRDSKHCGECDHGCATADCACQNGKLVTLCPKGYADCDSNAANGCEVNVQTSLQHCGSCGRSCHTNGHDAISAVCMDGRCQLTCQSELFPELDCDGDPDNGCETSIWTDNQNCGACGVRCTCIDGRCS